MYINGAVGYLHLSSIIYGVCLGLDLGIYATIALFLCLLLKFNVSVAHSLVSRLPPILQPN